MTFIFLYFPVLLCLFTNTSLSLMVKKCLTKCFGHSSEDNNLQMSESNTVLETLHSENKESVKQLITSENQNLGPALRVINLETNAPPSSNRKARRKISKKRRSINKTFMKCLEDVTLGQR